MSQADCLLIRSSLSPLRASFHTIGAPRLQVHHWRGPQRSPAPASCSFILTLCAEFVLGQLRCFGWLAPRPSQADLLASASRYR